jgi:hypothetical protein
VLLEESESDFRGRGINSWFFFFGFFQIASH